MVSTPAERCTGISVKSCPSFQNTLHLVILGSDNSSQVSLIRLLPGWHVAQIPILAVYPDNRQIAAKVRTFIDFLARRLAPDAPPSSVEGPPALPQVQERELRDP